MALIAAYLWVQRRQRRYVMRFTNLKLLERVAPRRPGWWRHVPTTMLLLALILLTVGLAGPTADVRVPRNRATIMLVIDVSLSMNASDVPPTRLLAAEDAATRFVDQVPRGINLGLETFAGTASVLSAPTLDRAPVQQQLHALQLAESTATGDAIALALSTIDTFNRTVSGDFDGPPPARIVLMSDGKQTIGRDEFDMARQAGAARTSINTISFGTPYGNIDIDGRSVGVPVDDDSLNQVAQLSGGQFFPARSSEEIHRVYDTLATQIGYETVRGDASKPWLVLGTLAALVAAASALVLNQRLPT